MTSTINKEDVTIDPLFLEEEKEDLNNYLESTGAAGIALLGTPEQAPGLKDYDHLARCWSSWKWSEQLRCFFYRRGAETQKQDTELFLFMSNHASLR